MNELLSQLQESVGLSHNAAVRSLEQFDPAQLLQQPPLSLVLQQLSPAAVAGHEGEADTSPAVGRLKPKLERADRYYYRSLLRVQKLRALAKGQVKDLNPRETTRSTGYVEHLLHLLLQQRRLLRDFSEALTELSLVGRATVEAVPPSLPSQVPARQFVRQQTSALEQLGHRMAQYVSLAVPLPSAAYTYPQVPSASKRLCRGRTPKQCCCPCSRLEFLG